MVPGEATTFPKARLANRRELPGFEIVRRLGLYKDVHPIDTQKGFEHLAATRFGISIGNQSNPIR